MKHIDLKKTYQAVIENSVGSSLFKNLYVKQKDDRSIDVLQEGEYACAFYVSNILKMMNLIKEAHATVSSTVEDMKETGWTETEKLEPGSIIVWEAVRYPGDEEAHRHIGFVLDNQKAISINYTTGVPVVHPHSPNNRKIEKNFGTRNLKVEFITPNQKPEQMFGLFYLYN